MIFEQGARMRLSDWLRSISPAHQQATYWVRVLRYEPTAERQAAFTTWLNASAHHQLEFQRAKQREEEIDKHIQRFYRAHPVDITALIERFKQEQRTKRYCYGAALFILLGMLLLAMIL